MDLATLKRRARKGDPEAIRQLRDAGYFGKARSVSGYPVSSGQQRMWLLQRLFPNSAAYNMPSAVQLEGPLDRDMFFKSFDALTERHESLRTVVRMALDQLRQFIQEDAPRVRFVDLTDHAEPDKKARQLLREDAALSFDLEQGPPLRAMLLRTAPQRHIFYCNIHHAFCDEWSQNVLLSDLFEGYSTYSLGREPTSPSLPIQYRDYAARQVRSRAEPAHARQRAYWSNQLAGVTPLEMPHDNFRPAEFDPVGENVIFELDEEVTGGLDRLRLQAHATWFQTLTTVVKVLLHRYTDSDDITVGAPEAGRGDRDLENQIGYFVNTLVLRDRVSSSDSFRELLSQVKSTAEQAYEHAEYPFDALLSDLKAPLSLDRSPLFSVAVIYQEGGVDRRVVSSGIGELRVAPVDFGFTTAKFDLSFYFGPGPQGFRVVLNYAKALFRADTISRMAGHFQQLAQAIVRDPDAPVGQLEIVTPEEKRQLMGEFNNTRAVYPTQTIAELFETEVTRLPHKVAVVGPGATWTYQELNSCANRIAAALRSRFPDTLETLVGVLLGPSEWTVATLIGILKAGCAYVPLDPAHPPERLRLILRDSRAQLLLTGEGGQALASEVASFENSPEVVDVRSMNGPEMNGPSTGSLDSLAYVIYTSGSTGIPKGCCVEQRNIIRLLKTERFPFEFSEDDTWIVAHSFAFDFSVWEMYGALLYGGTLVVPAREDVRDVEQFWRLVKFHGVTVLNQTPGSFYNFISQEQLATTHDLDSHLRYVIFGGDRLEPARLREWAGWYPLNKIRMVNMFGITETTVHVTYGPLSEAEVLGAPGRSPIGVPLPETTVYVLNSDLQLQPPGVSGELYVGGSGVSRGYLNRPSLTSERFVSAPWDASQRLYKSGDIGRWSAAGTLEHFGRNDNQVQIRGFRVELREIEGTLQSHPSIENAIAIARDTADDVQNIVAYYTSREPIDVGELRQRLRTSLPAYMMPAHLVPVDAFRLTSNGKIDLKVLPEPVVRPDERSTVAPRDRLEIALVAIWERVLAVSGISIEDDFGDLGGDSINIIRLLNAIAAELGVRIAFREFYGHSTVAELAGHIRQVDFAGSDAEHEERERRLDDWRRSFSADPADGVVLEDCEDVYPMSDIEKGMVFHSLRDPAGAVYHDQFVHELEDDSFSRAIFHNALKLMVGKHPILRTSFHIASDPIQVVHREMRVDLDYLEVNSEGFQSSYDPQGEERRIEEILQADRQVPFNISSPGLWRARLVRLSPKRFVLIWSFHHAILDGWSNASFLTELLKTYFHLKQDPSYALNPLPSSYRDFVADQLCIEQSEETRAFWSGELDGFERSPLPLGRVPSEIPGLRRKLVTLIDTAMGERLQGLARDRKMPIKEIYLAAFVYWLGLTSGKDNVLFGLVSHGRPGVVDGDRVLGCFLNSVPLRFGWDGSASPLDLLRTTHEQIEKIRPHARLSTPKIAEAVGESAETGNPLFDVLFNFVDFHVLGGIRAGNRKTARAALSYENTNTPFDFSVSGTFGDFSVSIYFDDSVYSEEEITHLVEIYVGILSRFASDFAGKLSTQAVLGPDAHRTITAFNETTCPYPSESTIASLFEEQARSTPDRIAVYCGGVELSYAALNAAANIVGRRLRGDLSIQAEERVGVLLESSEWTAVALLAILKAGGAYVPLDPSIPASRTELILRDTGCRYVLTNESSRQPGLPGIEAIDIESIDMEDAGDLEPIGSGSSLAYVIYTSGSSGRPKGSLIEQKSVIRLVRNTNYVAVRPQDRILQGGSIAFDACTFEIWGALLNGAAVVFPKRSVLADPLEFAAVLKEQAVTILFLTTSLFNQFVESNVSMFRGLRILMSGGERVSPAHFMTLRSVCPGVELLHVYGPTENTTFSTFYRVSSHHEHDIPIGSPISNSSIYVLGRNLEPLPLGTPGEIFTGGDGVARGYLNDDDLTRRVFVADPFRPGGRLYRTGDRGRWLRNGVVQFLGRIDSQVKVRGFRVELGEVEQHMRRHPLVGESIVVAAQNVVGAQELTGYYTSSQPLVREALRSFLAESLPAWMIPAHFVALEAMPVGHTGKINRAALGLPKARESRGGLPSGEREAALESVWAAVLNREQVAVDEVYFEIGGDSIKAIQIAHRLKQRGWRMKVADLFQFPTISELAPRLAPSIALPSRSPGFGPVPLSPVQHWFFEQHSGQLHHFNISMLLECREAVEESALRTALAGLYRHHDTLRMVFEGVAPSVNQSIVDPGGAIPLAIEGAFSAESARRHQAEFQLDKGPLVAAVLFRSSEKDLLMITLHHLIADAVTCRILLDDLGVCYEQARSGQSINLPPIHFTFRDWSNHLAQHAQSKTSEREVAYWEAVLREPSSELLVDRSAVNRYSDCHSKEIELSRAETKALLACQPSGRGKDTLSILLTALGRALQLWHGGAATRILLEGHGRHMLEDDIEVNRTAGWFTALFPFALRLEGPTAKAQVDGIRQRLEDIPGGGVGFGVARHLAPESTRDVLRRYELPRLAFNYLGEFADIGAGGFFQLKGDAPGPISGSVSRASDLEFTAAVIEERFGLSITYSSAQCSASAIERLAANFRQELLAIVTALGSTEEKAAATGLSKADLDTILRKIR